MEGSLGSEFSIRKDSLVFRLWHHYPDSSPDCPSSYFVKRKRMSFGGNQILDNTPKALVASHTPTITFKGSLCRDIESSLSSESNIRKDPLVFFIWCHYHGSSPDCPFH
ncbi:hypothetical protein Nepgr_028862 [Nepenthes gracilis]|uniref:Uncharacterized protein n=1 Tax=Nepenthes gracilis TaxID=150966 RepID=A0AAD3TDN4_NEPGR|nr:hypothetical protein Nepgr_028862 [Nepenthes gracilis]